MNANQTPPPLGLERATLERGSNVPPDHVNREDKPRNMSQEDWDRVPEGLKPTKMERSTASHSGGRKLKKKSKYTLKKKKAANKKKKAASRKKKAASRKKR